MTTRAKKRAEEAKKRGAALRASEKPRGAGLFQCPSGHLMPHRVPGRGRCTEFECCIARSGAHGAAKAAFAAEGKEAQAYAEETEHLLEQRGRHAAWDAVHPLPKVATAPELKPGESVHKYLRARAAQAAPLALERIIRRALLVPGASGDAAADNILDRVGFTRKAEPTIENNGPVFIVNFDRSRVPLLNQPATDPNAIVEGEYTTQEEQGEDDGRQVPDQTRE